MKTSKRILYFVAFVTTAFYLTWRLVATIPWHDSWFALIFGILLWGSEVVSAITGYILIWNKQKDFELEKPEIAKERYPDVDVLIATHNEDPELLYKTINACTFMEYPDKSKVHIYVCDDTNRLEVAKLADELGVGYFGLADNKDAKSGNYNNALRQTSSPLVATFDADMIPYREFLLETVPYFVEQVEAYENGDDYDKSKVGLIQTPQSFYNADIFQFNLFSESTLPNEQDFFSKEINVGNNSHGAAVYTGSNTVIFRKAIEDVGGFPTDTITEDFELGVRMNAAGYVNYSTKSPMASGLTPTDLKSVIKQRTRWGRGVIRSSYNMNIFFFYIITARSVMLFPLYHSDGPTPLFICFHLRRAQCDLPVRQQAEKSIKFAPFSFCCFKCHIFLFVYFTDLQINYFRKFFPRNKRRFYRYCFLHRR